jgi:predicted ATPase
LLNKLSDHPVNEALYLAETPGVLGENQATLLVQTQAWLGKILSPLSLKINPLRVNLLELLIGDFKPSNVGFGYSSILPIIVTGLIAKPGEKIIIENPEIHLHPKAQSALIEFLIKVANTGVQIFIESHSDHVLNALRVATKNGLLKPEDSSVLFFNTNTVSKANEITSILVDEKGKLHKKTDEGTMAKIPQGFFDEWTNAMAKLF